MNMRSSTSPASGSEPAGPARFALQTTIPPGAAGEPVSAGKQARWFVPNTALPTCRRECLARCLTPLLLAGLLAVFIKRTYVSGKDLVWDGIGIGVGVVTANLLRDSLGPDSGGGYRFVGLRTAARLDCSRLTREAILQGMARSAIAFPTAPAAGIAIGAPRGAAIAVDTGLRPSTLRLPRATRPPGSFRFEGD